MECQHPRDNADRTDLLLLCPDCGARCTETEIGDDQLCYDDSCPLHVFAGTLSEPEDKAYGLTFWEWLTAAGRSDSASEYDLRAAWRAGESPSEYAV